MINTKDNIWIKGFNTENEEADFLLRNNLYMGHPDRLYSGETSEISEELAKECVKTGLIEHVTNYNFDIITYKSYNSTYSFLTPQESIQSALQKEDGNIYPYCVIFKK